MGTNESSVFTEFKTAFGLEIDQKLLELSQYKHLKFRIFSNFFKKKFFSRDIGVPAHFRDLEMKAFKKLHKINISRTEMDQRNEVKN